MNAIGVDGFRDVFELAMALVFIIKVQVAAYLFMGNFRYPDAARFRHLLQTCRNIDAIAKDVSALDDDIAQVNANTKTNGLITHNTGIADLHAVLNFNTTLYRRKDRGKLQQQAVAHGSDNSPAMFGNQGIDQLGPMGPQ